MRGGGEEGEEYFLLYTLWYCLVGPDESSKRKRSFVHEIFGKNEWILDERHRTGGGGWASGGGGKKGDRKSCALSVKS